MPPPSLGSPLLARPASMCQSLAMSFPGLFRYLPNPVLPIRPGFPGLRYGGSCQRMMPRHEIFQPTRSDMGIDLSRRNVGMTEHFLQGTQIGTVIQEMRGEGVTQDMRRDGGGTDLRPDGDGREHLPETLPGQMVAGPTRRKQPRRDFGAFREKDRPFRQVRRESRLC